MPSGSHLYTLVWPATHLFPRHHLFFTYLSFLLSPSALQALHQASVSPTETFISITKTMELPSIYLIFLITDIFNVMFIYWYITVLLVIKPQIWLLSLHYFYLFDLCSEQLRGSVERHRSQFIFNEVLPLHCFCYKIGCSQRQKKAASCEE